MQNDDASLDVRMRQAAFAHVRALSDVSDHLTSDDLRAGFSFEGNRIPLINPQRGIFKPKQMRFTLSIMTVFPRRGARIWYDDQTRVHQQLYDSVDFIDYAFMGSNPDAADNRGLREAYENQVPLLYFVGVAPGKYLPQVAYIGGWDAQSLKARVGFGYPSRLDEARFPDTALAREYAIRAVKQRLHQTTFRQAVLTAYEGRCALSGLPEIRLLDAAHIIRDGDEHLGQPIVTNGIPLTKLHHAAFDSHLIGIDASFKLHVSKRLLLQRDGPMLEALKALNGQTLRLPPRARDQPDRDRLSVRFADFLAAS